MNRSIRVWLATVGLALWLGGCASFSKIESGEATVKDGLVVSVDSAWNQFPQLGDTKAVNWTKDGLFVDRLQFFVGIKDGEEIESKLPGARDQRPLTFRANMSAHEVVQVLHNVLSRDGSTLTPGRLDPATFVGETGFRMEYQLVRKGDDVQMQGLVFGAVRQGRLYLMHYTAPRMGFFGRHVDAVERMARSARLKG